MAVNDRQFEIEFLDPDAEAFVFTFGRPRCCFQTLLVPGSVPTSDALTDALADEPAVQTRLCRTPKHVKIFNSFFDQINRIVLKSNAFASKHS
jgi:hypothetical protein